MRINIVDASNYFKGLLLLIRKDRSITESEIHLMQRLGKILGFEREFCEVAIQEVLENAYIVDETPEFSTKGLSMKFIKDGIAIACSDGHIHPAEREWLKSTTQKNGLSLTWLYRELSHVASNIETPNRLEVDTLTLTYS